MAFGDDIGRNDSAFRRSTYPPISLPGHFRAFARTTGRGVEQDRRQSCAIMETMQATHSPETERAAELHLPSTVSVPAGNQKYLESKHDGAYSYNACRVPFRAGAGFSGLGRAAIPGSVARVERGQFAKTGAITAKRSPQAIP